MKSGEKSDKIIYEETITRLGPGEYRDVSHIVEVDKMDGTGNYYEIYGVVNEDRSISESTYDDNGDAVRFLKISSVSDPDAPPSGSGFSVSVPDMRVHESRQATLTANVQNAKQGPVTYEWKQTGGIPVDMGPTDAASLTFTAPEIGEEDMVLTFLLTVTDSSGAKASDTCNITVFNEGPGDTNGCFIKSIFLP